MHDMVCMPVGKPTVEGFKPPKPQLALYTMYRWGWAYVVHLLRMASSDGAHRLNGQALNLTNSCLGQTLFECQGNHTASPDMMLTEAAGRLAVLCMPLLCTRLVCLQNQTCWCALVAVRALK
jgi:hypothetical protein